ncbi:hypothetical protein TVAG_409310 [Trichomonas vaginalis G3]|uniref:Uncharacterized protein n=1 Tax=Trichomonas vaginalis (strain ATCC PRA-98 / G3) TaxID=412133 RepID=A2G111_TRIV3|nr:hypothetical protein TVAGG3_0230710 [Trichomonas vaginalis G3]EAX89148.1 hypothetical protein TVAG_409310 [Trichomonas vaginalis G3]KAI5552605.1 hypothetical protein TVAGG3_0230710 [Trichomonas vaginalis G3]|eukprot:XP_001302078.1 hypothetical protein [Trichomonas vaginalis G3]
MGRQKSVYETDRDKQLKAFQDVTKKLEAIAAGNKKYAELLGMVYSVLLDDKSQVGNPEDETAVLKLFEGLGISEKIKMQQIRQLATAISQRSGIPYTNLLKKKATLFRWYSIFWPEIKDYVIPVYNEVIKTHP